MRWTKSTRSIAVIIFSLGATIGLFVGVIPSDLYAQALMLVLGAYFGKRDTPEERK